MSNIIVKNPRLIPVAVMAIAISLPIAIINLSKLLLLISAFFIILKNKTENNDERTINKILLNKINALIIISFIYTSSSYLWTSASLDSFAKSVLQHGNFLIIPLLTLHIKNIKESVFILKIFCLGQLFQVLSSWLIFIGIKPIWTLATIQKYAVFSSELDQSIMNALFATILWHLRHKLFFNNSKYAVIPILLAIFSVFYIFEGRTGHIVLLTMIFLTIWWSTPIKFKFFSVLTPLFLIILLFSTSTIIEKRFTTVVNEYESFSQHQDKTTSTGARLDFWINAVKIIDNNNFYGSGAGSWSTEYYKIKNDLTVSYSTGNPHQEYFLWLVELGFPGLIILLTIFYLIYQASMKMPRPERQANLSLLATIMLACLFNCILHDALIGDYLCFVTGLLLITGSFSAESKV